MPKKKFVFRKRAVFAATNQSYAKQHSIVETKTIKTRNTAERKKLYLQTLYENLANRVITQTKYKELRENYQNEIENLLSELCCLEEIQKNGTQKIENILKLKEVFKSTQI